MFSSSIFRFLVSVSMHYDRLLLVRLFFLLFSVTQMDPNVKHFFFCSLMFWGFFLLLAGLVVVGLYNRSRSLPVSYTCSVWAVFLWDTWHNKLVTAGGNDLTLEQRQQQEQKTRKLLKTNTWAPERHRTPSGPNLIGTDQLEHEQDAQSPSTQVSRWNQERLRLVDQLLQL